VNWAMGHFYFDESIHDRGGFIVGAYVYGPDADAQVTAAIDRVGLRPGLDEFKSSSRMDRHPEQVALRDELRKILVEYRLAVLVTPSADRAALGEEALRGLDQIAQANNLVGGPRLVAALDEGVFDPVGRAAELSAEIGLDRYCEIRPEQDSRAVKGLQLADLVAHTAATMLLETLGLVRKHVKAGSDSGYEEDLELELGFELWAGLRYQFLHSGPADQQEEAYQGALMEVGPCGLRISAACSADLRAAALDRFGQCYLGCIH
jgi:hypothetical protein